MIGYTTHGIGAEKVIVTHGWKTDHSCYDAMRSSLNPEKYTYVFIDQRGYGASINMKGPYTIEQVAADIIALADKLGFDQYHLIGHSMGGKVIQRIMADRSEQVKSAVGITPCPACRIPFDDEGWALFSCANVDHEKRLQIFRLSTGNRLTENWYKTTTAKSFQMSLPDAFRKYLDAWVHYDLVDEIKGNSIPIKIIAGEHDPDLDFETMKNTFGAWLPNAQIVELPNCGHYPMFETPLSLAAECQNFIDQHC